MRTHLRYAGLAAAWMVSPAAAQIALQDVAAECGLIHTTHIGPAPLDLPTNAEHQSNFGCGCAVGDYDGDGDLDVYLMRGNGFPNALFRNELVETGSATFRDVTAQSGLGLDNTGSGRLAHFADLDGDADLDLLVVNDRDRAGELDRSRIFENLGGGQFRDATQGSGFFPIGHAICGCSLADFDQDGLLDIFLTAWTNRSVPHLQWAGRNRLFRNLGGLQFEDVTTEVGLDPPDAIRIDCYTAIFADITQNGHPDLHVAVDFGPDLFYRNDQGTFTLISDEIGMTHVGNDMGITCADLDGDLRLDFYQTNITDLECFWGSADYNALMMQTVAPDGTRSFTDEAITRGVADTAWGWGTEFIDLDNDGDLDLAAANGYDRIIGWINPTCSIYAAPANVFENDGTGHFTEIQCGFEHLTDDSRALVSFDFDRDGDQDILITNIEQPVRLMRNDTPRSHTFGHAIDVRVVQRYGNHHGIGTRVDVKTADGRIQRHIILAGESYLAGTPAEAHFGLGPHQWIDWVRVHWENGTATTIRRVFSGGVLTVEQPEHLSNWDRNGRVDHTDAWLFAWAWILRAPEADLNGDLAFDLADVRVFLADWRRHEGPV